ncbi:MAG: hypothetical protein JKX88_00860 [Marinicaulis sp.]|nr:hypothetical protein [Marinicaulis sp.]
MTSPTGFKNVDDDEALIKFLTSAKPGSAARLILAPTYAEQVDGLLHPQHLEFLERLLGDADLTIIHSGHRRLILMREQILFHSVEA